MSSRRRRGRATGRFESGRHYAILLDEVMRSPAFKAQPHFARSVFAALAAQYRGANNGDLSITSKVAVEYGIDSSELSSALSLLEAAGLIEKMRQGLLTPGKAICTLWALTCWPIDPSEKYDVPVMIQRPAPNTWATWIEPEDWWQRVRETKHRAKGRKFPSPHVGSGPVPTVGSGEGGSQSPRGERRRRFSSPHVGDTFYDLGRGQQQVEAFITQHPDMSDVDVAVVFKWKVSQFDVARIREGMGPDRKTA